MVERELLHCRDCDAYHRQTSCDRAPSYSTNENSLEITHNDDERSFCNSHVGHHLESLFMTGEKFSARGSLVDPMQTVYIEVSNGSDRWVLRRFRTSIDEAMQYERVDGMICQLTPSVEIQAAEIRKEMRLHHDWAPAECLSEQKISRFLSEYRQIVGRLSASEIRLREYSADDDLAYGRVDANVFAELLEACRGWMTTGELAALKRFVAAHDSGCDVMTLMVRHRTALMPTEPRRETALHASR